MTSSRGAECIVPRESNGAAQPRHLLLHATVLLVTLAVHAGGEVRDPALISVLLLASIALITTAFALVRLAAGRPDVGVVLLTSGIAALCWAVGVRRPDWWLSSVAGAVSLIVGVGWVRLRRSVR
jgi:hypothetical protein